MGMIADFKSPFDPSTLKDKSVLVTGGVSGIGALTAALFARHGARVTVADINEQQGRAFAEDIERAGTHINFIATDVTDWTSQVQAFKSAIKFSGRDSIDIVVAAAGLPGAFFTSPDEESTSLERDPPEPKLAGSTIDVNAKGVYFTSKLAQHYFALPTNTKDVDVGPLRKSLILISSLAGYLEINAADYTASKWAVRGLFRSIRSKMEDLGYRTNLIAPWVMDTPMSKGLAGICRQQGFPVGDAKDVAQAVVRCAADDSICGLWMAFSNCQRFADKFTTGRAIAVGATETFDLRDDIEGLNGGLVMKDYLKGEAKDFMAFLGQRP